MKDIKSYVIGFLTCACLFLIMGQTKSDKKEVIMQIEPQQKTVYTSVELSFGKERNIPFNEPQSRTISKIHYYNKYDNKIEYFKTERYKNLHPDSWSHNKDSLYLYSAGYEKNETVDGEWTYYYENGQISSEGNYIDGHEDGNWKTYYENGQISREGNYKTKDLGYRGLSARKDGNWTTYYENGQISSEGNYIDGHEDGKWTNYHEDGSIDKVEEWKDGIEAKVAKAKADAKKAKVAKAKAEKEHVDKAAKAKEMKTYTDELAKIEAEIQERKEGGFVGRAADLRKLEHKKIAHIKTKPK